MKLKQTLRMLTATTVMLVLGYALVGCNKTEEKAVHDPKTDMSEAERKDKKGGF